MAENEKLDCLRKLQDVLQEKFTLEQQVETLPRELRKEEAVLRSMEKDFSDLRTLAEELCASRDHLFSLLIKLLAKLSA